MADGVFLAFEGVEGSGKSTQIAKLADRLRSQASDPLLVRQPGGTPLAEAARELVLHGRDEMSAAAELFLYLVARADLIEKVIRPALNAGRIVMADRSDLSTRAYQVGGRGLPAGAVDAAITLATGGLEPDLFIVLDLPIEAGRRRQEAQGKKPDRLEREDDAFHERVAQSYLQAKGNVVHIDATKSADTVHSEIWQALASRFPQLFA